MNSTDLYYILHRIHKYYKSPKTLRSDLEILEDIRRTRREVEHWSMQGDKPTNPDRIFAIVSFANGPTSAKFHCLAAKVTQLRGYTPMIFTKSDRRFGHEYYRMFGLENFVMWDKVVLQQSPPEGELWPIVDSLMSGEASIHKAKRMEFHGVQVGKHALSKTCRQRVEGRLVLGDPDTGAHFRKNLFKAVQSVTVAERFLDVHPIHKMLVRDTGYTPNASIYEVALQRGVDCVAFNEGQRRSAWIFKRYTRETRGRHYFSLSSSSWEQVKSRPWREDDNLRLEQEFAGRYRPDSTDDTRHLQEGKFMNTREEVQDQLKLDPNKKTAVIFSHIAWDAAFFYGESLFEDFEDWLFQTVEFVGRNCPHMNWIVKEHPFNVFKLQRQKVKVSSERRLLEPLMPLPDHVRFMAADTSINTRSLFPVVDYVLTVNGTVGMEFPCFGIPAVIAGTGRYDGFGFTLEPDTREEYFDMLRNLHTIPRLNQETQELARRHYLALMVGRQISFEDVAPMRLKRIHEAQSGTHVNIHFNVRTLEDFKQARSVRLLGDWLDSSTEEDLIDNAGWRQKG